MYTMGVDIGSASSKAVILKDGKDVLAAEVVQVGTGSTGPKKAMEMAFEKSGVKEEEIDFIIATGYGRFSLEDAGKADVRNQLPCKRYLPFGTHCTYHH